MTQAQELLTSKQLFWGIQILFAVVISLGAYVYTSDQKAQAVINRQQDIQILKLQEQMIEVLRDNSSTDEILKRLEENTKRNETLMREGFIKIEEKIDKIK